VIPIRGDARNLQFVHDYFDAIMGIGSSQESATDNTYIWHLLRFLRRGGQIGLAEVSTADLIPDGWRYWLVWEQLVAEFGSLDERKWYSAMTEGLIREAGRYLGVVQFVATRLARTTCTFAAEADSQVVSA
jgi:ubiquinone/menaquinone biosynthesis C-methylase UbiE